MSWESHTLHTIKKLYNDERFDNWSKAINNDGIKEFSDPLQNLLERLGGIISSEFFVKMSSSETEKLLRILEMAAMGGKTL